MCSTCLNLNTQLISDPHISQSEKILGKFCSKIYQLICEYWHWHMSRVVCDWSPSTHRLKSCCYHNDNNLFCMQTSQPIKCSNSLTEIGNWYCLCVSVYTRYVVSWIGLTPKKAISMVLQPVNQCWKYGLGQRGIAKSFLPTLFYTCCAITMTETLLGNQCVQCESIQQNLMEKYF